MYGTRRMVLSMVLILNGSFCCAGSLGLQDASVTVDFDHPLRLIVLKARIEGEGPFRFILDSGTHSTVIETDLAKRLGLSMGAPVTGRSTATGSEFSYSPVLGGIKFFMAPALEIQVDRVLAAPFSKAGQAMAGEHFDGILGSAFFQQFIIEVDYARQKLTFHDPEQNSQIEDGELGHDSTVLPLIFPMQAPLPFIEGSIINEEQRLTGISMLVDTGGQLLATASLGSRNEWESLITPKNKVIDALGATGLSNEVEGTIHEGMITRMDHLIIGPYSFDRPVVSYSGRNFNHGAIGASVLYRFTVIFDYGHRKLILKPNRHFQDPIPANQSGLFLTMSRERDGTFLVMHVARNTPAAEAGLERGDLILAINGTPSKEQALNTVRLMFCQTTTFKLDVNRDGKIFSTVLETRPLFSD